MKKITKYALPAVFVASFASAQALVDYQYEDANGTQGNVAVNAGTEEAAWNFGYGQTQTGSLNYGYTQFYKFNLVDGGAGTTAFRRLEFQNGGVNEALTAADVTAYSMTVDFSNWDLRKSWDPDNDSAPDKGIQIQLDAGGGVTPTVGFTTQSAAGFRAFSQGAGSTFTQANGSDFTNPLNRFEADGGILQINGDLSTGLWSARAADGEGGAWIDLGSGSGVTNVGAIVIAARSPSIGSWGGAGAGEATDPTVGGTAGDFMRIDSLTLTAVPEPSIYALFAGAFALTSVMLRRRQ